MGPSGREDLRYRPYDPRSVTALIAEIRNDVRQAERKEGVLRVRWGGWIAGFGGIEDASRHLIRNDDSPSDGLFKCAGTSDRCIHRTPVDYVSGRSTGS